MMRTIAAALLCFACATANAQSPPPQAQPVQAQPPTQAQSAQAQAQPEQTQPEQTQPEQMQPEQAQPPTQPEQAQPPTQPEQAQPPPQPEQAQPPPQPPTQPEQAQLPTQAQTATQAPAELASKEPSIGTVVQAPPLEPPPPPSTTPTESLHLPRWHAPRLRTQAQFLTAAPEAVDAHKLRQIGLYISSAGWVSLLGGGVLQVWSKQPSNSALNEDPTEVAGQQSRINNASIAIFAIGGAATVAGFVMFTVGQSRLAMLHHKRPRDPLPPLSGY